MTTLIQAAASKIDDAANGDGIVQLADALLAPLLNELIPGFQLRVGDAANRPGLELSFLASYDSGGAAAGTPFQLKVVSGASLAAATTALQAFMTTNSGYFFSPVQVSYVPETRNTEPYFLAVVYNPTLAAGVNFG